MLMTKEEIGDRVTCKETMQKLGVILEQEETKIAIDSILKSGTSLGTVHHNGKEIPVVLCDSTGLGSLAMVLTFDPIVIVDKDVLSDCLDEYSCEACRDALVFTLGHEIGHLDQTVQGIYEFDELCEADADMTSVVDTGITLDKYREALEVIYCGRFGLRVDEVEDDDPFWQTFVDRMNIIENRQSAEPVHTGRVEEYLRVAEYAIECCARSEEKKAS